MTEFYIAQFCNIAIAEAFRDDMPYGRDLLEYLSTPTWSGITLNLTPEWVEKLKKEVEQEILDCLEEDETPPTFRWEMLKPVTNNGDIFEQSYECWQDDEFSALLIIRRGITN